MILVLSLFVGALTPTVVIQKESKAAGVYGDSLKKLKKNQMELGKKKTFTATLKESTKIFNKKAKQVKGGLYKKPAKVKIKHTIEVGKRVSSGSNYKVTFKCKAEYKNNPKIQTKKISAYSGTLGSWFSPCTFHTLFDYSNGAALDEESAASKVGVKVKVNTSKTKRYPKQKYKVRWMKQDPSKYYNYWIQNVKSSTVSFTVTYPKTYKDLCVGIGSAAACLDDWMWGYDADNWSDYDRWGESLWYKKGSITYICLPGDDEQSPLPSATPTSDPSSSPEPTVSPVETESPSPTPTSAPEQDDKLEKINKEIDDANKAYSEKWTTATRWKKYEETANAVLVDLSEYSKTYEVNFHNLPYTNSEGNAIFGDRYETFATNLNKAIACITSDMMNISDTSKSKTFSNLSQLKLFLKTNVSNKSIKSAVTRGTASGDTVSVHLSLFLNHETDCEFKVKDISGLENDGTVIV